MPSAYVHADRLKQALYEHGQALELAEKIQAENERLRQTLAASDRMRSALGRNLEASQLKELHAEGLFLRMAYAIANRADAAQAIGKWLREHGAQDGWNRPLLDAIVRRMETAPDWPVPPGFKLDSDANATASDRRETYRDPAGIERSCALDKLARDAMSFAESSEHPATFGFDPPTEIIPQETVDAAVADIRRLEAKLRMPCTCVPGLGFQNYNPTCPRHG